MEEIFLRLKAWVLGVEWAKCENCGWTRVSVNAKAALGGHKRSCDE